jgi:hypothetical protein
MGVMGTVHSDISPLPVSGVPSRHKDGATRTGLHLYTRMLVTRFVDPRHFNADPDPAFHLVADPDPSFHFKRIQIRLFTLMRTRILLLQASTVSVHGPS